MPGIRVRYAQMTALEKSMTISQIFFLVVGVVSAAGLWFAVLVS